jgi:hypothetical protein
MPEAAKVLPIAAKEIADVRGSPLTTYTSTILYKEVHNVFYPTITNSK